MVVFLLKKNQDKFFQVEKVFRYLQISFMNLFKKIPCTLNTGGSDELGIPV
jgi:hypothetical protein